MRRKQLTLVAAVAALPLALGVLPASAEEITGELSFDAATQTYAVDGTEVELTDDQLESTEFGDLDGDGANEVLSDELDGVIALGGDAPELTVTVDDETGAVTALAVAQGDGDGDGEGDDGDGGPDPEQLPEQASDTAVSVLTVISQWEGERGCEFGHAVAEAAGGNAKGECPDDEGGETDLEGEIEELGDVESQGGPGNGAEKADAGKAKGAEGRARGAAAAEAGPSNGQGGDAEAEDAGPPEGAGPPDDAGPPDHAGPPSSSGGS